MMAPPRPVHDLAQIRAGLAAFLVPRSAILGIGNRLAGDDAFGPLVLDQLRGRCGFQLFDVGLSPENYVQRIAAAQPPAVLLLDAAESGTRPGRLILCAAEAVTGTGPGTHGGSLSIIAAYLEQAAGATVRLLLAQPAPRPRGAVCGDAAALSRGAREFAGLATIPPPGVSRPVSLAVRLASRYILAAENAHGPQGTRFGHGRCSAAADAR